MDKPYGRGLAGLSPESIEDDYMRDYERGAASARRGVIRRRLEALLPGWPMFIIREHSAYCRDSDSREWLRDDRGHSIIVGGWAVNARNPHGRSVMSGAFETAEEIAADLRRYESLGSE